MKVKHLLRYMIKPIETSGKLFNYFYHGLRKFLCVGTFAVDLIYICIMYVCMYIIYKYMYIHYEYVYKL